MKNHRLAPRHMGTIPVADHRLPVAGKFARPEARPPGAGSRGTAFHPEKFNRLQYIRRASDPREDGPRGRSCHPSTSERLSETPRGGERRFGPRRSGISLIEVMLATAMLLGSVMMLSRMAFLARKHAHGAQDRSMTQSYCQTVMEEILSGVRPMKSVSPTLLDGEVWIYMVQIESVDEANLREVAVTVDRLNDPESTVPKEDDMGGYRLVRWVRGEETGTGLQALESGSGQGAVQPLPAIGQGVPLEQKPVPEFGADRPQEREPVPEFGQGFQQPPARPKPSFDRPPARETPSGRDMPPGFW